jgi:2-isopropylmalate synthase
MPEHISLVDFTVSSNKKVASCTLVYTYNGKEITAKGEGNGPIDACKNALLKDYNQDFTISSYSEHSCGDKSSAKAVAYIQIQSPEILSCFGVGRDNDIATASIKALFSALNRAFN